MPTLLPTSKPAAEKSEAERPYGVETKCNHAIETIIDGDFEGWEGTAEEAERGIRNPAHGNDITHGVNARSDFGGGHRAGQPNTHAGIGMGVSDGSVRELTLGGRNGTHGSQGRPAITPADFSGSDVRGPKGGGHP